MVEADVHRYRGRLEVRHLKTMGALPWLWDRWELVPASTPRFLLPELLLAAEHGVTFMLDLKGLDPRAGTALAAALHEHAPDRPVLVCSRYWRGLRAFDGLPWVRTVASVRNRGELALLLRTLRGGGSRHHGASVHRSLLTPAATTALHEHLELVLTWPVDDLAALDAVAPLAGSGAVGVISRSEEVLRRVLDRR